MRKELRVALERFREQCARCAEYQDTPDVRSSIRANAAWELMDIILTLGGLEAALADDPTDDPTDNAPDLAAVVAAQGVALEALGQQVRDLAEHVRLLEGDLKRAEDALLDVACERSAPDAGWLVEPVRVTLRAIPGALIPHVSMVRWSVGDTWPAWRCELFPARHSLTPGCVRDGHRVGVRPDGRLEVVS